MAQDRGVFDGSRMPGAAGFPTVVWHQLHEAGEWQRDIVSGFNLQRQGGAIRTSHFIGGRHENCYLDPGAIPGLVALLDDLKDFAARCLGVSDEDLGLGFWFNDTPPGHTTSEHSHDEDDELLSGVYYLAVAADSGDLVLRHPPGRLFVRPAAGKLVVFPPHLSHRVEMNRSGTQRLSIGFNVGMRTG